MGESRTGDRWLSVKRNWKAKRGEGKISTAFVSPIEKAGHNNAEVIELLGHRQNELTLLRSS
jgi:hypothetical protein